MPAPLSASQAMEAVIAQPTAQPTAEVPPALARKATLPAATLYSQGMQAYTAKKLEEARSRFVDLASEYPDDKLTPNALYWTGETWYDQRDYAQAILAFKEVPRRFKDHEKTPAALLKIAYCYEKLGDRNNAVFYLRTLIDEFPGKEPVRAAQAKLKELGG
jgi:tol-pal system protein YbgF